ncbi:aldo/keto reductase [Leifsonia sp. NPDC058248]|uniref:aldo/keto reductase n=1 Tax=Leifsonia sp. NPDC058248 TaxID=3346402 RepID=UPI0036D910E0
MTFVPAENRYDTMTYNRSGRSGLKLPPLSLGLWHNFGDERPIETQRAIVRRAFDLGITHFDLANNYGPPAGTAETNFGRLLREDLRPYRDEIVVSTKAGYYMWPGPYGEYGSRKNMLSSLDQSLGRLGLDYVDIFYSHRPDPETPIEETMGALATAVKQGKALYVGISNYNPEETRAAAAALAEHKVPLLIHQPRYSMFDREIEGGLFPVLDEIGAGSIVYSPLAQGMLTDRYLDGTVPAGSRAATSNFLSEKQLSPTYLERARALNAIAARRGQSLAQLALLWVLRQPTVTSALIGASSVRQLEQNVATLDAPPLTPDEVAEIDPFAVDGTEQLE